MSAYFRSTVREFLEYGPSQILGELNIQTRDSLSTIRASAIISWERTIAVLKSALSQLITGHPTAGEWSVLLEYEIPRRARRIDAVLLVGGLVIVLELKTGESGDETSACRQVEHYALDLRDFHRETRDRIMVPIVVLSRGPVFAAPCRLAGDDFVREVLVANDESIQDAVEYAIASYPVAAAAQQIDLRQWDESAYAPVPNIIEAAQMLYANQSVRELSHAHADVYNLTMTTDLLVEAVTKAQTEHCKIICFVTGVPGAGKTLAGLNAVHCPDLMRDGRPAGAFLSGNGPLVKVISAGLARDHHERSGDRMDESRRRIRTFIQSVHSFLKEYRPADKLSPERVIVFDEAQRAWDSTKVRKKFLDRATAAERHELVGVSSEPTSMLSILDRWPEWAVLIALVGGGQEIYDGEAGLAEWGRALRQDFQHWRIWASPAAVKGGDSVAGNQLFPDGESPTFAIRTEEHLHLPVSVRSFRAEAVSAWVNAVIAGEAEGALKIASQVSAFPIVMTRSLSRAREWLRSETRGLRRCGLLASSGALRLRAHGLEVSSGFRGGLSLEDWFLAGPDDIRSSNILEVALTEFECQGLELDWIGLCWGDDFNWTERGWDCRRLNGSKWQRVQKPVTQQFIRNKYRVLLTRAREGMVIWVPLGDANDITREPDRLNSTADFLVRCGVTILDEM